MSLMFQGCKSLKEKPNISKWNVDSLFSCVKMFDQCDSLPK